jgi:hypothetical protein
MSDLHPASDVSRTGSALRSWAELDKDDCIAKANEDTPSGYTGMTVDNAVVRRVYHKRAIGYRLGQIGLASE